MNKNTTEIRKNFNILSSSGPGVSRGRRSEAAAEIPQNGHRTSPRNRRR